MRTGSILILLWLILGCKQPKHDTTHVLTKKEPIIRNDFKSYYDKYGVTGCFALYDLKNDQYYIYNKPWFERGFTPASTFKICNSLIGIETGVIPNENFVLQWDGTERWNKDWNHDTDLKTAYKNSTVWYYQELARRVGGEKMKFWLDKAQYGNTDTTGGIDKFWLTGGLRISPKQQLDFLKRLYKNHLPFSTRTTSIVKKIMIAKDTTNFTLRAKTGWGFEEDLNIGWYVGYIETNNNTYMFANIITTADSANTYFKEARIAICYAIFKEMGIYKGR